MQKSISKVLILSLLALLMLVGLSSASGPAPGEDGKEEAFAESDSSAFEVFEQPLPPEDGPSFGQEEREKEKPKKEKERSRVKNEENVEHQLVFQDEDYEESVPEEPREWDFPEESSSLGNDEDSHEHQWEKVTQLVHHPPVVEYEPVWREVEVVDEEAYEETVFEVYVLFSDGVRLDQSAFESEEAFEDAVTRYAITHEVSYVDVEEAHTVYHPRVTHTEGRFVEEEVILQEAYEEEVVVGYQCSICLQWKEEGTEQ